MNLIQLPLLCVIASSKLDLAAVGVVVVYVNQQCDIWFIWRQSNWPS